MPNRVHQEVLAEQGLITVAAAARLAEVHRSTIYRWINNDVVKSKTIGGQTYVYRKTVLEALGPDLCKAMKLK